MRVVFFHCNPRHHTIAFAQMPRASKRLHHFMLQLRSLDEVGATYDLCQTREVPIAMKLGKNTNDHMVSFYRDHEPAGKSKAVGRQRPEEVTPVSVRQQ